MKRKRSTVKVKAGTDEWRLLADKFERQARPIVLRLQKARDQLRVLLETYSDILESCDEGLECIEDGLERISGLI